MNDASIRISPDGRYFTDRGGSPLFWLGDTQWNLFRCHTREEAAYILKNRRDMGFSVIQAMLPGFRHQVAADAVRGEAFPDNDPSSPNPAYFEHVDAIVEIARQCGIILAIGADHPWLRLCNSENAGKYGTWLGERFRSFPNIIWVASYFVPEGELLEITRELARGLREGALGAHLITCHPDPAHPVATSGICHEEKWLDFNCIQTFNSIDLIYGSVIADLDRIPAKPVVLAEGAYEGGPEYGFDVTPRLVRKQAYLSCFAGGHPSYGHNDNWRVTSTWRESLDSPGARQMTVLKNIFTSLRWWELQADQALFAGNGVDGFSAKALRSPAGDLCMVYSDSPSPFALDLDRFHARGTAAGTWINPENEETVPAESFPLQGIHEFHPPSGWQDSVLILK